MLTLEELEARITTILPDEYQDRSEEVKPVSMGSAKLKYGLNGKVAWDEIWGSFCDLAMAGGPPHKGSLLEPGTPAEIAAEPDRYQKVVREICRGIAMVADLPARASNVPGWIRVECMNQASAEWLVRAIVMENVSARAEGSDIELPAGPSYRVDKEIKNVITVIAKTCHYWFDHTLPSRQREVAGLFAKMAEEGPLLQPALPGHDWESTSDETLRRKIAAAIEQLLGLRASDHVSPGWLGVECPDVRAAIWLMRAMVVSNILARREGTVLFVPVNPTSDPNRERVVQALARVQAFAKERGVL